MTDLRDAATLAALPDPATIDALDDADALAQRAPLRVSERDGTRRVDTGAPARAAARAAREGLAQAIIDSPLGPLLALAGDAGLRGLWFDGQQHFPGALDAPNHPGQRWIAQTRQELAEYFAGRRRQFDVALDPQGTPFQQDVWRRLVAIGCGRTSTYGDVAREIGRPSAFRAVGLAVGRNPISILVPCHRVIGGSGSLTGYAGGLPRKRFLLGLELGPETLPLSFGVA